MNKKFLLLGAAFAMANVSSEARVGGFYIGASGSANIAQFKIYDASSHAGCSATATVTTGSDGAKLRTSGITTRDISKATSRNFNIMGEWTASAVIDIPSILASNEENTAEEGIFKIRPSGRIFVGYNYQIGSNIVAGFELSGGMAFGAHKYFGVIDIPDLKKWEKQKDAQGFTLATLKEGTPFNDKTTRTTFEVKTRFEGDASLRLGYLIPGTDGRLAFFLRGGVGLMNREIKATQASIDPYVLAISNAAHAASGIIMQQGHENYADVAETINLESSKTAPNPKAEKMVAAGYFENVINLQTGPTGWINSDELCMTFPVSALPDPKTVGRTILADILGGAKARDSLFFKDLIKAPSLSKSSTKFTWHAGADAEYHFASGLFVRASYTFKYAKGFFAEAPTNIPIIPDSKAKEVIDSSFKAGEENSKFSTRILGARLSDQPVLNAIPTDSAWTSAMQKEITDAGYPYIAGETSNPTKMLLAVVKNAWKELPIDLSDVSLGILNSKLGLGSKSYYHDFSLGIGFKFLG